MASSSVSAESLEHDESDFLAAVRRPRQQHRVSAKLRHSARGCTQLTHGFAGDSIECTTSPKFMLMASEMESVITTPREPSPAAASPSRFGVCNRAYYTVAGGANTSFAAGALLDLNYVRSKSRPVHLKSKRKPKQRRSPNFAAPHVASGSTSKSAVGTGSTESADDEGANAEEPKLRWLMREGGLARHNSAMTSVYSSSMPSGAVVGLAAAAASGGLQSLVRGAQLMPVTSTISTVAMGSSAPLMIASCANMRYPSQAYYHHHASARRVPSPSDPEAADFEDNQEDSHESCGTSGAALGGSRLLTGGEAAAAEEAAELRAALRRERAESQRLALLLRQREEEVSQLQRRLAAMSQGVKAED